MAAVYVYGIVRAKAAPRPSRPGVASAPVVLVPEADLVAVASELPEADFRARREDLLAHSGILQDLVESTDVLPLTFGTLFDSVDELTRSFLRPNHEALVEMLDRMQGCVEVQVKGEYDQDAVAREILASDRTIQKLQARSRNRGDVEGKIELGRRFAAALDHKRYADGRSVIGALTPFARDVSVDEAKGEYGVVNASFLVARDDLPRVDEAFTELQSSFGGRATLRCLGPLPPYSFVDAGALAVG